MSRRQLLRVVAPMVLGGLLLTGGLLASVSSRRPVVPSSSHPHVPPSRRPAVPSASITRDSLTRIVARDPFRISRSPAEVVYDPLHHNSSDAPPAPPPRPQFLVTGILWSEAPSALVEGFPGFEGPRLVRQGDRVDDFRVLRIRQTAVEIRGPDTTWTLVIREPWR